MLAKACCSDATEQFQACRELIAQAFNRYGPINA